MRAKVQEEMRRVRYFLAYKDHELSHYHILRGLLLSFYEYNIYLQL